MQIHRSISLSLIFCVQIAHRFRCYSDDSALDARFDQLNSYVHIIQANLGDVHKKSALIFVNLVKIISNWFVSLRSATL